MRRQSTAAPYIALALTSLGAAGIHFAVMGDHFAEYFLFGLFFSAVAWLQALWAVAIVVFPDRRLLAAGLVGNLSIALIWGFSRTTGLPVGPDAGTAEAVGFADVLSTALELLIVAGCAWLLASQRQPGLLTWRAGRGAVAALTIALIGLTTAAIATGAGHGEEHATHEPEATGLEPETIEVDLGGGHLLRAFVDSPPNGSAQMHFIFFEPDGTELSISSLSAEGISPSGSSSNLAPERFGPGHFVSTADLELGEWEVHVTASTGSGDRLTGTLEIHVE
jgi:hypothetical protein